MTITEYSKALCVQCAATDRRLDAHGITPDEVIDLSQDAEALAFVKRLGHLGAPVLVVRDDDGNVAEHWAGFRPDKIDELAARLAA